MAQGKAVSYRGTLKPAGLVWRRPSKYRLAVAGQGRQTCYVYGNDSDLARLKGRIVELKGREYWLRGVRYAIVVPEQISASQP